jgi:hypothetical protein
MLPFRVDDRLLLIEGVPLPRATCHPSCSTRWAAPSSQSLESPCNSAQARKDATAAATSESFRVNGFTLPSARDRSPLAPASNDPTSTTQHQTSVPRRLVCSFRGGVAATVTFARAKAQHACAINRGQSPCRYGGSSAVFQDGTRRDPNLERRSEPRTRGDRRGRCRLRRDFARARRVSREPEHGGGERCVN